MGQGIGRVPEAPAVAGAADDGREPIGRYIAQQRRLRGIELEEIATRTRIPRRSLERLEAGAFDHSPDGFSRGFVRTVAEAIGLDPDDAVARMLHEPDASRRSSPRSSRTLAAIAATVALLGLALAARQLVASLSARPQRVAAGELPVRRDYVRALAEAQGIATAKLTARDAVLAPLSPPATAAAPATPPAATTRSSAASGPPRPSASEPGVAASASPASTPNAPAVEPESLATSPAEPAAPAAPEPGPGEIAPAVSGRLEREAASAQAVPEAPAATTTDAEAHD